MPDSQVGLALLGHVVVFRDKSGKDMFLGAIRPYISVSSYFEYSRSCFYIAREGSFNRASSDDSNKEIVLRSCENGSSAFANRTEISLKEALRIIDDVTKFEAMTDEEFTEAFDKLFD